MGYRLPLSSRYFGISHRVFPAENVITTAVTQVSSNLRANVARMQFSVARIRKMMREDHPELTNSSRDYTFNKFESL